VSRGHRHSVLLVDEEGAARNALRDRLQEAGFEVMSARHGRAALQLLALGIRPCAILVDVRKPGVAGTEFRRAQQYDPELREIPVVVLADPGATVEVAVVRRAAEQRCWARGAFRRDATRTRAVGTRPARAHRRERDNGL
jgi:CheY-like chemotaxis protein